MKKIEKIMLENQILNNQILDSFDQIFDLNHYYIYKEHNPNAFNHAATQKSGKQNLKFVKKIPILKTYLQVDSSQETHPITFLGHQGTFLDQKHQF